MIEVSARVMNKSPFRVGVRGLAECRKRVLSWEKSLKKTADFVIPAKAGIQNFFELFDF